MEKPKLAYRLVILMIIALPVSVTLDIIVIQAIWNSTEESNTVQTWEAIKNNFKYLIGR